MIKALLDTNVLVSGFASFKHPDRAPAQILHAWRAGLFELVISEDVLIEIKKTLQDAVLPLVALGVRVNAVVGMPITSVKPDVAAPLFR